MGIEVRAERLDSGRSGYCELRGRRLVFLDASAGAGENLEVCLQVLARLPQTEMYYLPAAVREEVDRLR